MQTRATRRPGITLLFVRPHGAPAGWERTTLWREAEALPEITVLADPAGTEALRFGATASGHVLLYDAQGALLFSGGITASRGHQGDNVGATALSEALASSTRDNPSMPTRTPVFGCALLTPEN